MLYKMLSILDLPEEIKLQIFSKSSLSNQDLYNLALVNKYLYTLASPLLYREVILSNPGLGAGRREIAEIFTIFEESIAKSPERALLVRSIRISCNNRNGEKIFPRRTCFRVSQLLGKLKSMKELRLTTSVGLPFPAEFLDMDPAPALTHVRLLFSRNHMWDITKYLCLPNIEYLELKWWVEGHPRLQLPTGPQKPSRLRRLKLETLGFGPSVAGLLDSCQALTEFTCTASANASVNMSPSVISHALSPLGQNLATLNLTLGMFTQVDATGLNLANLKVLKELSVHSNLLFEASGRDNPVARCGLYKRLPPSLERLKIFFPGPQAAFQQYHLVFLQAEAMEQTEWSDPVGAHDCDWVLEILDRKVRGTGFQRLERIHIVEDCSLKLLDGEIWDKRKQGKYEIPEGVRDAFEDAGVILNVKFKAVRLIEDWIRPDWEWE